MAWSSWSELEESYKGTVLALEEARARLINEYKGENNSFWSDKENLGSMVADVTEVARILKQKVLYEFNSLSAEELAFLTDRQREIAELRQRYNYYEIAQMTGLRPDEAFHIFQQAVAKIKKIKHWQENNIPLGLSPQQEQIYILYRQGKKTKEIAEMLKTSCSNVRYQLTTIKKKLLVKTCNN
ncbi:MAG TPA: response regulator transcription factor [Thermoanaerobacterales bacterium]|nr:response regulator transcription factor [Thermoanaerobacterales bacterium]